MSRSGSILLTAPFLRLLFPLCLGVYISTFDGQAIPASRVLWPTIIFLFLVWYRDGSFYFQHIWTFLLLLLILLYGMIRASQERIVFPVLRDKSCCVVLDDYPKEKEKTVQVVGRMINSDRRILIYLPKSTMALQAGPGKTLVFDGVPEVIENDGNPFEFDYRSYLNDKGIGYRIFLKEGAFFIPENKEYLNLYHKALIFRKKIVERLLQSNIKPENAHLIGSISFGARDEVDKETIQSFTNTGVIHVLAVSGMNVGLIYVVLDFLFRFLKSGRTGSVMHTFLMIFGIWSYTLIAGMSASILRAAVMFTFVIIGNRLGRNSNIINSLAVSAFILIACNPSIIRDVGFQLSYASLVSIIVIQPYIYKQLSFRYLVADKIWLLLSVTIAAQIGTLPFTLLYFHQFPVYFWLANLVVVPLVTLILYLSVAFLFLTFVSGFLASVPAKILDWSADLVMVTVRKVGNLPHSVISNIYPHLIEIVLIVLMMYLIILFIRGRKKIFIYAVLIVAILLTISEGIFLYLRKTREEVVFYNIPGTRALVLTSGGHSIVLYDRCDHAEEKLGYYMNPYFGERGITAKKFYLLNDTLLINYPNLIVRGDFISFNRIRIFVEPLDDGVDLQKPLPDLDLAWLRGISGDKKRLSELKNCGIILQRSGSEGVNKKNNPARPKFFELNKSVLLTVFSSPKTNKQRFTCNYFNNHE